MSAADRQAEREVADHFNEVRSPDKPREARRAKRFAEAVLTGLAIGSVARKLF